MTTITDPAIDDYCARASLPDDELLERLAAETERDFKWHRMMVGNLEGAFLRAFTARLRPVSRQAAVAHR